MSFQICRQLSAHVNLREAIDLYKTSLNYASVDNEAKLSSQLIDFDIKLEDRLNFLGNEWANINDQLRLLHKSDIVEMKAYRSPPNAVQQVAEAVCLIYSKPASFDNFKRLIESHDFINQLSTFDAQSIAEYTLKSLEKYIRDENFNQEYISKISKFASYLCSWCRLVYKFGCLNPIVGDIFLSYMFALNYI